MSDDQPKGILPQKNSDWLSKVSNLAKRGLEVTQNPTNVQHSKSLSQFLDSIGGIPENSLDTRFQEINGVLRGYFSKMTMNDISKELEAEFQKRPNGRTLKLLGFSYSHLGWLDNAVQIYTKTLEITVENPFAIYEEIGRCYILKGDWEKARLWFEKSHRYDFDFFLDTFGLEYLYITTLESCLIRPPMFGRGAVSFDDKFVEMAQHFLEGADEIEQLADAIRIQYGNKSKKSLFSGQREIDTLNKSKVYEKDPVKAKKDIEIIQTTASQLFQELKVSKWIVKIPDGLKQGLNVLDATQKSKKEHKQIDNLLLEGKNLKEHGKTQQAIKTFEKALMISNELDYEFGKGSALGYLGVVYNQMDNPRLAIGYLDKALAICRATGNRQDTSTNLVNLGNAYQNLGDKKRAIGCYKEALTIDREIGNPSSVAMDLFHLGWTCTSIDNTHQAIEYFDEALTIFRKIKDENGIVSCLFGLATCLADEEHLARALPLAEEAARVGNKIKHPLAQQAKELFTGLQTMYKDLIDQAYQAFLNADTPLDMEKAVMLFPFLADDKFIDQLKNAEIPKSLDFDTRFSDQLYFSKKVGWVEQIASEEQFVSALIDFDNEDLDTDGFQTRCLRTYIPTMVLSPKYELGFQAFLCTCSISELKKIVKNFPYMISDSSFITGVEYVIQSLPRYEHPEALRERLNALKQLTKK